MSEKKQLNEAELEKVTGGERTFSNPDRSQYSDYNIYTHADEVEKNKKYLFVAKSEPENWMFGAVYNIYPRLNGTTSYHIIDIIVEDGNGTTVTNSGGTKEYLSYSYYIYRNA